jgi:4-hydroxybenzoate polyprenyltransferase
MGYDTIYALQDLEDDRAVGIGSSALTLGRWVGPAVTGFYLLALALWAAAIWLVRPDPVALAALLPAAVQLLLQVARLRPADPTDALARFRSNRTAGWLVFAACLVVGAASW